MQHPTRFNLKERIVEGEWLDSVEALDGVPKRRTTVTIEHPRSILTRNSSPDIGFDRSINAYRGCEHGCIYCFARPTHAYHDLSPGVDFESRLFVKPNAAQLLHGALSRPGYECAPIAMGTNTDPYQPIEERWRVTRSVIEVLVETRHPFTITTKSDRVLRDLDLLVPAAELGIVSVAMSVTSLDPKISRERSSRARRRAASGIAAIKALNEAGVPCHVAIAPVVPQITDHELEAIVEAACRGRARRLLSAGPPAARGRALVPRLARRAFPRPRRQGHGDDPLASRRSRQRSQFLQPDARARVRGPTCCAPGSRKRRSATACRSRNSPFAATCSYRPKARRCGCSDHSSNKAVTGLGCGWLGNAA